MALTGAVVVIAAAALYATMARARPEPSVRLGGNTLELFSAHGSLWVVTCDRRCTGEGRRSEGRIVRIDPGRGRVLATGAIERPGAVAVGANRVFAIDFWRQAIRRLDSATLRPTASLKLVLPPEVASTHTYAAFLPTDVTVGGGGVWVATEWCSIARIDEQLSGPVAQTRLPCDSYETMAFGAGAL